MTISGDELLSLVPVTALAFLYIITDITTFNRLRVEGGCIRLTRTQMFVLVCLYPIWIFLTWIEALSTRRADIVTMTFTGSINTLVGWLTTIFVFNDDYSISPQQYGSLASRFVLNAMWRWNNYLVYATSDGNVSTAT